MFDALRYLKSCFPIIAILLSGTASSQDSTVSSIKDSLKVLLSKIGEYEYEMDRTWQVPFQDLVQAAYGNQHLRATLEESMIGFLSSDASLPGKQFICQQLIFIGTGKSVPVLTEMLGDPQTSDMAVNALSSIPDSAAFEALIHALSNPDIQVRESAINAIAVRKEPSAVKHLKSLVFLEDESVALASIDAIGQTGGLEAMEVLSEVFDQEESASIRWVAAENLLHIADQLPAQDRKTALEIYEMLFNSEAPVPVKTGALRGRLEYGRSKPERIIEGVLVSGNDQLIQNTITLLPFVSRPMKFENLKSSLAHLTPADRGRLMMAFAARNDPGVRKFALTALSNDDTFLEQAGLRALKEVGTKEDVRRMAELAANGDSEVKELARINLYSWRGEGFDQAILNLIPVVNHPEKRELIRAVGERNMVSAADVLSETMIDPDGSVRIESVKTIGRIGSPEWIPQLIEWLKNAKNRTERNEAIKAITILAERSSTQQSMYIIKALPGIQDPAVKVALIEVLGNIGSDDGFDVLKDFLSDPDDEIQQAAIKALSGWPNSKPIQALEAIFHNTDDQKKHTLALMGYVQLFESHSTNSEDQVAESLISAFEECVGVHEERIVLSGLGNTSSLKALEFATGLIGRESLNAEAEACVLKVAGNILSRMRGQTRFWLERAAMNSENEDFMKEVEEFIEGMY